MEIRVGKKKLWRAEPAGSVLKKAVGIMFREKKFAPVFFEFAAEARAANSIHSLFCPEFDAVFLDAGRKVVEIRRVKPFSFVTPSKPAKYLIEVPAGLAKVKAGARLSW
ncbi:MAG: DUF192 domain-containing protein [Candidatus Micrarchaeota archaeon]|nr:DUF192 domain-containing protein [Candidatus Micrarchaeota archaeon]